MSVTGQRPSTTRGSTGKGAGYQPRTRDQLPRPTEQPEREVGKGLAAVLGILALVVGVPALLIFFVGNPLPTSLPDSSWLQAELTASTIINVFGVLIWLVWGHFVICLLSELRAMRAGRVPSSVPLGSASQLMARRLIAGILLLAGTATMTGNSPTSSSPPDTSVVATATIAEQTNATAGRISDALSGRLADSTSESMGGATAQMRDLITPEPQSGGEASGAAERGASDAAALKYYEVKPPQGRNYDTLWDIADRHLGDPFRYKEIFELNRDRPQPDGRRLVDADLIHPGWQLVMPADASGPDVYTLTTLAPPSAPELETAGPAPEAEPAATESSESSTSQGSAAGGSAAEDSSSQEAAGAQGSGAGLDGAGTSASMGLTGGPEAFTPITPPAAPAEVSPAVRSGDLGDMLLGGGLLLAGVLVALTGRRGAYGTPDPSDQALRLAAHSARADLLDRALRALARGRSEQRLPLPDISAVYVNDDQVVVHVAGTPAAPPAPWNQADEGRSWTVRREQLEGVSADGPAPWPALVAVAQSHGYDLLVDLEYAPGLISLAGDGEISREIAFSLAADLVTHPWSDAVSVTMVGFGDDLADLAPSRVRRVATIEEAIAQARAATADQDSLLASLGVDGVLAGRAAGSSTTLQPQVLVLSGPPDEQQAAQLNDLTGHGRSVLTTVCVGNSLAARWRFTVDRAGNLDLGALGVSGEARRLTPTAVADIRGLLRHATAEASKRATEASVRQPQAVAAGITRPADRQADRETAPARVELLGPVQVIASGPVTQARRALLTELVTVVGLHPDGVHESVLRVALWPRGVEDDVVRATLGAAQQWLGVDGTGRPLLDRGEDGRWRLAPPVYLDWHEFADAAASAGDDPQRLLVALELARGVAFSELPPGRYTWLAFHQSAREARVLATTMSRKAGSALLAQGDRAGADRALRLGLRLVPQAQSLWRDLARLHGDGGAGSAAPVIEEMKLALAGVPWEPETDALVSHLTPSSSKIS